MKLIKGATATILAFGALAGSPAQADDLESCYDDLRQAVESQLARFPGGVLVAPDTVSYGEGEVVVRIHPDSCPFQPADLRQGRSMPAVHLWNEQAGVENHWAFSVIGRWVDISRIPNKTRYRNGRSAVFWSSTAAAVRCHSPGSMGVPGDWQGMYLSVNRTACG